MRPYRRAAVTVVSALVAILTITASATADPSPDPTFPDVVYCTPSQGPCNGTIKVACPVNTPASGLAYDPVGAWGEDPSPHAHSEIGAANFSPFTTLGSLATFGSNDTDGDGDDAGVDTDGDAELGGLTSCVEPTIHDEAFWPTVLEQDDVTPAPVVSVGYYLGTKKWIDPSLTGYATGPGLTPIDGLRQKSGDSECASLTCSPNAFFCRTASGGTGPALNHIPSLAECQAQGKTGGGYQVEFPVTGDCWNPANGYGEGFGTSGPAADVVHTGANPCPSGYLAIPSATLVVAVRDTTGQNLEYGGRLSSDSTSCHAGGYCGASAHWDLVFGFTRDSIKPALADDADDSFTDVVNECFDVTNQNPPPTGTSITCAPGTNGYLHPNIAGNKTDTYENVTN